MYAGPPSTIESSSQSEAPPHTLVLSFSASELATNSKFVAPTVYISEPIVITISPPTPKSIAAEMLDSGYELATKSARRQSTHKKDLEHREDVALLSQAVLPTESTLLVAPVEGDDSSSMVSDSDESSDNHSLAEDTTSTPPATEIDHYRSDDEYCCSQDVHSSLSIDAQRKSHNKIFAYLPNTAQIDFHRLTKRVVRKHRVSSKRSLRKLLSGSSTRSTLRLWEGQDVAYDADDESHDSPYTDDNFAKGHHPPSSVVEDSHLCFGTMTLGGSR